MENDRFLIHNPCSFEFKNSIRAKYTKYLATSQVKKSKEII